MEATGIEATGTEAPVLAASEQVPPAAGAPPAGPPNKEVRSTVWRAFWTSRLLVLLAGVAGTLEIRKAGGSWRFDPGHLTAPYHSYFGDLLVGPFARWDSVWYLTIANMGYGGQTARAAFFPLYPMLIHALAWITGDALIAGMLISLVCFGIALALLYRLTYMEFGQEVAQVAVALVAFSPFSFYFSAVYTESLFLALTLGAIYCARTERWAFAAVLAMFAAATRNSGVLLIVPIALMFLYGPRGGSAPLSAWALKNSPRQWLQPRSWLPKYKLTPAIAWLLVVPIGLLAYMAYLWHQTGTPFTTFNVQTLWNHQFVGPITGTWDGIVAAWDGFRQIMHGPSPPVYFKLEGGDSLSNAGVNITWFAFVVLGLIGVIGAFRRLPFAYAIFALLSLLVPLSSPVVPAPFSSMPRYEMVVFPLFIWGAYYLVKKKMAGVGIGAMAMMLGFFTMMFTTWRFIG
jgi:mannosyltransferase PIG-V